MPGTDLTAVLARTLQALRAERGWSLDQLAARSGVSKGVLVSLEQGRSNPNLATLARIGDAFGLPVTRLIDPPSEPAVRITGPGQRTAYVPSSLTATRRSSCIGVPSAAVGERGRRGLP